MAVYHVRIPGALVFEVELAADADGEDCLTEVCRRLGVIEVDYFGLHIVRDRSRTPSCWINLRNRLMPQMGTSGSAGVFRLHLKVKFFVEPHLLLQESTRHLFYMYVREELKSGRLTCNPDIATRICGLIAQAKFGDHWPSVLAEPSYPHLPNTVPQRVSEEHIARRSTTRSTCEYLMLQLALKLKGLGLEWHKAQGVRGDLLHVSVGTNAVVVQREDGTKMHRILFLAIQKASVTRRLLSLEMTAPCGNAWKTELQLFSSQTASNLYRSIIEHHAFYSCDTVTMAVKNQCSRTFKNHLVSLLFSESTAIRKTYYFDVQRTAREAYEHFRRVLYHAVHALEIGGDISGTENSQVRFSVDMKSGMPGDQIEGNEFEGGILTEHQQQRDGTQWDDETVVACATCQEKAEAWQRQQEAFLCVMCCQQEVGVVFCPCGHVICCEPCASHIQVCPVCRHDVERIQQIYLPVGPFLPEA
uniref:E3 ubiquitin-protein ligase MYLIP n=1 Tax=Myxine glutinosa TaxID=7769 RepID=UPI00358F4C6D